ncbi:MAG: hypothetical protein HY093_03165 [Candidatus Liptonbacteria bacterium]|nr:hypothetical protein [Candidatus Liptonbacteria bacterium]
MTLILKKFFTAAALLALTANIASAALVSDSEETPITQIKPISTIKKVTDPITKQEVLIETKKTATDPAKINKPASSTPAYKAGEKISAQLKILSFKKTGTDPSADKTQPTITDPVVTGINFLKNNQNPDGSFGSNPKTKFLDTSAVADLLGKINQKVAAADQPLVSSAYSSSRGWIDFSFPENNDYLAQKISTILVTGLQDIQLVLYIFIKTSRGINR